MTGRLLWGAFLLLSFTGCGSNTPSPFIANISDSSFQAEDTDSTGYSQSDLLDWEAISGPCEAGEKTCIDKHPATCTPPYGWLLETCPEGSSCVAGDCVGSNVDCNPGETRCSGQAVEICTPDGTTFAGPFNCPESQTCVEGECMEFPCSPGKATCNGEDAFICSMDGNEWVKLPCAPDGVCYKGSCVECALNQDCQANQVCVQGECVLSPLRIATPSMPDGTRNQFYEVQFEAAGGVPPYIWAITDGDLPVGLSMSPQGLLSGHPADPGFFQIKVTLGDSEGHSISKQFEFTINGSPSDFTITSGSPLPPGEQGMPYTYALAAQGGTPPYAWGVFEGNLPPGLNLTTTGMIQGIPFDNGHFTFMIKVYDDNEPPQVASRQFTLDLGIAPLQISGDEEWDLWAVRVIILPMITLSDNIPHNYTAQLHADGGVLPYKWDEREIPGSISWMISEGGLPEGLVLEEDGVVHGSVGTDAKVTRIDIPLTDEKLEGFFFQARVRDKQAPPAADAALFMIPTHPLPF